jgi:hypothetical protein
MTEASSFRRSASHEPPADLIRRVSDISISNAVDRVRERMSGRLMALFGRQRGLARALPVVTVVLAIWALAGAAHFWPIFPIIFILMRTGVIGRRRHRRGPRGGRGFGTGPTHGGHRGGWAGDGDIIA